jgi:uncharacterized protein YyaL (SSP411 family)
MPTTTHTNRLINEKSPYLLQHAHNPVDWYPWGDDAFNKAKAEDKPLFLSIGYSTCHWCHVMEQESFEDEDVAAQLNKSFVSIKVDREERPDVDNFYMSACMALNGSGGWPLSCFLSPDKNPFFAGTYFPKNDSFNQSGFLTVLGQIAGLWKNSRDDITDASSSLLSHIKKSSGSNKAALRENADAVAFNTLSRSFDAKNGGFGGAPKFPSLQNILFLMRYGLTHGDSPAFDMVGISLDGMKNGGIYDHVGGGFCRYSTDARWLAPHFEKMLYDNALHIMAYSEAAALFGGDYARVVRETIEFVLRELADIEGGFYTAIDADSEGEEGKFYLFTPQDVQAALGEADGARYCALYDITGHGNFEGKNIPNLIDKKLTDKDRIFAAQANKRLLAYRGHRIPPFRDDKILVSNNGLMIAALSIAGRILGEQAYISQAEKCADFLLERLISGGRLLARWRQGEAGIPAACDDYAYLFWGLIELYEATFDPRWLNKAISIEHDMDSLFWDEQNGGYYLAGSDIKDLPLRQKEFYDGALPSGNSVAALSLLRLARLTGDSSFEDRMKAIFKAAAAGVNSNPAAHCGLMCALLYLEAGGSEIIIVNGESLEALKGCLPRFAPFMVSVVCGAGYELITQIAPFLGEYSGHDGRAAAYVCSAGSCMQPVTEPADLKKLLEDKTVVF